MVTSRQETRRHMYLPSPTNEVHYRGKDDGCCGIFYLKHVLYVFNFILVVTSLSILLLLGVLCIIVNCHRALLTYLPLFVLHQRM